MQIVKSRFTMRALYGLVASILHLGALESRVLAADYQLWLPDPDNYSPSFSGAPTIAESCSWWQGHGYHNVNYYLTGITRGDPSIQHHIRNLLTHCDSLPLEPGTTLYRGVNCELSQLDLTRPQFNATSTDPLVAARHARPPCGRFGTELIIHFPQGGLAGQIPGIESEMLLRPGILVPSAPPKTYVDRLHKIDTIECTFQPYSDAEIQKHITDHCIPQKNGRPCTPPEAGYAAKSTNHLQRYGGKAGLGFEAFMLTTCDSHNEAAEVGFWTSLAYFMGIWVAVPAAGVHTLNSINDHCPENGWLPPGGSYSTNVVDCALQEFGYDPSKFYPSLQGALPKPPVPGQRPSLAGPKY